MKNILGIIGSPRKLGNSEIMVKEISRNIPEAHELRLLRLPAFDIQPCKACYACLFKEQRCVQKDDFAVVLEAMVQADALIVAVPTYFLGAHSCLKGLQDRALAFYGQADTLWGKPAIGVSLAGIPNRVGGTKLQVESFLKSILAEIKGSEVILGALPGEIFFDPENKKKAAALGQALLAPAQPPKEPCCPLCGSDSFRFTGAREVNCLLCGNPGKMEINEGRVSFTIQSMDHEMFLTTEAASAHVDWLRQMKDRFLENRQALKEVCSPYAQEGTWINPPEK
jgi:multimeric flavodoxin WrbA